MSRNSKFSVRSALKANNFMRTPRKPNWSDVECDYLLQEIQKNLRAIRSRKPDCLGSRKSSKTDMWNRMCAGLHMKRPTVVRSVADLKDKWKKLQFMAKQYISQIRDNSMTNRRPDGLIVIPKLVYRVLEVRGQDPKKLGFCSGWYDHGEVSQENINAGAQSLGNHSLQEQEPASTVLDVEQNIQAEAFKIEMPDIDQFYQEDRPNQSELTFEIESAVSLNPTYNQKKQSTVHQPENTPFKSNDTMPAVPVSAEKAVSTSHGDVRTTTFAISSRLVQHRGTKTCITNQGFRQHTQGNRPAQTLGKQNTHALFSNQPQAGSESFTSPQLNSRQDILEDPNAMSSSTPMDEPQARIQLEGRGQNLPHIPRPASNNTPNTYPDDASAQQYPYSSAPQPHRLCPAGLVTHVCDEQVVELQREVLQEERDKIRLEKEVLEMQREKLKLEMMFLRQKVNGVR